MKTKLILFILLLCPLFLLIGRSVSKTMPATSCTSLTVNGRPINYDLFTLNTPGVLTVIEGDLRVLPDRAMPYQSLLLQGGSAPQDSTFVGTPAIESAEVWPTTWLRGELGDAQAAKQKTVPFRVSLRRKGVVFRQWPIATGETVESLPLNQIWPSARIGDELIVEPMDRSGSQLTDNAGKQVIDLKKVDPVLLKALQEGC